VRLRAEDARPPEGASSPVAARVVLEVEDSGCGVAPADRERIFADFYTTKPEGSGLGLSNVRRLAADMGATVEVASEPGRGTRFTLVFPADGAA
jgi:signal transduction histidine kinase